ncbi:DNA gyrase inhibitor YacG [Bartonella raoultii]|uniref:DNA gyrase inhibitor YacG n=1 Tax=Bartonella raoultii TaxID=1457020 RepID=A0ABS7I7L1_9HYPH|nr:DNA gyrase inhibitor YacG [Bartonella raoultii]MBX4336467.1 DNA gyrase inhibitor YacG [Bartonella raoultii]
MKQDKKQKIEAKKTEDQAETQAKILIKEKSPKRPVHPCPICGQMSQQNTYPFCSARCRAIDLNRWLSGAYILPPFAQKTDEEE